MYTVPGILFHVYCSGRYTVPFKLFHAYCSMYTVPCMLFHDNVPCLLFRKIYCHGYTVRASFVIIIIIIGPPTKEDLGPMFLAMLVS